MVAVCTNIACMLGGAYELLEHAEAALGISVGRTTADGEFTLEEAECLADCDRAPCVQVNHRFFGPLDPDGFDALTEDLRSGRLGETVPAHGVLSRVERSVGLPGPRGENGSPRPHRQERCRSDHESSSDRHVAGRAPETRSPSSATSPQAGTRDCARRCR